mmetsp:Transcript_43097/g.115212  ORF Transcript_43097/g.115212 Transcript_43097/m.115212 type:complete len:613 (+) Transcript_43097:114-1952(+)
MENSYRNGALVSAPCLITTVEVPNKPQHIPKAVGAGESNRKTRWPDPDAILRSPHKCQSPVQDMQATGAFIARSSSEAVLHNPHIASDVLLDHKAQTIPFDWWNVVRSSDDISSLVHARARGTVSPHACWSEATTVVSSGRPTSTNSEMSVGSSPRSVSGDGRVSPAVSPASTVNNPDIWSPTHQRLVQSHKRCISPIFNIISKPPTRWPPIPVHQAYEFTRPQAAHPTNQTSNEQISPSERPWTVAIAIANGGSASGCSVVVPQNTRGKSLPPIDEGDDVDCNSDPRRPSGVRRSRSGAQQSDGGDPISPPLSGLSCVDGAPLSNVSDSIDLSSKPSARENASTPNRRADDVLNVIFPQLVAREKDGATLSARDVQCDSDLEAGDNLERQLDFESTLLKSASGILDAPFAPPSTPLNPSRDHSCIQLPSGAPVALRKDRPEEHARCNSRQGCLAAEPRAENGHPLSPAAEAAVKRAQILAGQGAEEEDEIFGCTCSVKSLFRSLCGLFEEEEALPPPPPPPHHHHHAARSEPAVFVAKSVACSAEGSQFPSARTSSKESAGRRSDVEASVLVGGKEVSPSRDGSKTSSSTSEGAGWPGLWDPQGRPVFDKC